MRRTLVCLTAVLACTVGSAHALLEPVFAEGEWKGEIGTEFRHYDSQGDAGQGRSAIGFRVQSDYYHEWGDGYHTFNFVPFVRVDQQDSERTHFDVREALWTHIGPTWELKAGVTRVHWGKTEFANVVDVINQKDFVEGDDDEKLGQPMVMLSLQPEWGYVDVYLLAGFRERPFPGPDGRLRTPIVVDDEHAFYDQGESPHDIDFAGRWRNQVTDELEMAVSVFSGIDREPVFFFNYDLFDPSLIPYYRHKDQIGLEMEYIWEGWIGKVEAINVQSAFDSYNAAVVGGEYTLGAIFESDRDLTLIAEYLWDERDANSPGFFEHDLGLGARLTFNDVQSTEVLSAVIWDTQSNERLWLVEATRRVGDAWKLTLSAQRFDAQGAAVISSSVPDALANLQASGVLSSGAALNRVAVEALGVEDEQALQGLLIANAGPGGLQRLLASPTALDTLNRLSRLLDSDRKLGGIESDDYLQLEVTYFY